ncbi:Hypothetical protein NGAL_HAMBI2605_09460 [Neorhizobium galegae bv. orientalis]|nr:Hypothetical protein NGAL_HAMBI2605_09460 [Neorhizobium galegae bv. orientalis]
MPSLCYFSPTTGNAWTVMETPSAEFLAAYPWPEDTIEVPLPPSNGGVPQYENGAFSWLPVPPTEHVYLVSKFTIWLRLSEAEAEAVTAAITAQPARLRGLWGAASNVRSDSEFFGTLKAFVTGVLGEGRANEILAPESA